MTVLLAYPAGTEATGNDREEWDGRARAATAQYERGEIAAALAEWQRLARQAEELEGEDVRRTLALHNLGALLVELGHPLEAIGSLEAAAERMKTGERAGLRRERTLNFLAMAYVQAGNYEKAERALQTVREISRAKGEADTGSLTLADLTQSRIQVGRGRLQEAAQTVSGALLRLEADGGDFKEEKLSLLNQLGNILSFERRWNEAEQAYRRVAEALGRRLGERHPNSARARLNLAWAMLQSGRAMEAERMTAEVVQVLTEKLGASHRAVGIAMQRQAMALRELRRDKEARRLEKRAERIEEEYAKSNQIGSTVDLQALAFQQNR